MTASDVGIVSPERGSQSTARACGVLALLSSEMRPQTLSEIAARLDLAKSSTLAILISLEANGLVRRSESGYGLDSGVLRLAGGYLHAYSVVDDFHHAVRDIPGLRGEVVQLAMLSGREVLYLARHAGRPPLFVSATPGDSFPASITAVGAALMAALPPGEVADLYHDSDCFPLWTSASTATVEGLQAKLVATRERGYGLDLGETNPQVVGLALRVERAGRHATPLAVGASLREPNAGRERWDAVLADLGELRDRLQSVNALDRIGEGAAPAPPA